MRMLEQAFDTAVTGARAMGLLSMRVDDAFILADAVVLMVVATDEQDDDEDDDAVFDAKPAMAPLVF